MIDQQAAELVAVADRCTKALPPGPCAPKPIQIAYSSSSAGVATSGSDVDGPTLLPSTPLKVCSSHSFNDSIDKYMTDPDDPRLYWQLSSSCTHYTHSLYART